MKIRTFGAAVALSFALAACASTPQPLDPSTQAFSANGVQTAAAQPLRDLNLQRAQIPPVLLAALAAPYAPPVRRNCAGLEEEIRTLDLVLGPDLETPAPPQGRTTQTQAAAGEAALGAVRDASSSWIPLRSVVRRVTGAEAHAQQVRLAILEGSVRRGYLKGLGQSLGCAAPAAPLPQPAASKESER
jgi:hypothetical protein